MGRVLRELRRGHAGAQQAHQDAEQQRRGGVHGARGADSGLRQRAVRAEGLQGVLEWRVRTHLSYILLHALR